ncbi:GroES-like protein [Dichomitus squalens]|uniref:GroES-like protein n=1 Tax=Dichomitus squalens TaxID=114155 RepID=A0A4Q9PZY4_9APHY|nr:GroES-like protein [Dichomitus squalens]TBU60271.1 GroES-like protein [Dichomitus squalens]
MSVPSHQKALFLEAKQGQWAVRTTEVRKPGSGDIVVKVEAAALGGVEWKIQAWGILIKDYPAILGMDGAGTVVELGEGVTTFAVGDRVMFQGNWDILTGTIYGTFLQYFTAPAQFVAKIPDSISFEAASTMPTGVATATLSVYNQADYALSAKYFAPWLPGGRGKYAGKPIVILGGPTSHGQYATQFAHLSGFSPIITTASLHNADLLKSFGATHVLDRKLPAEEIRARVSEIAGGPVGLVYDTVSVSATFPLAVALAAPGSTVLTVQWAPEELVAQAMKDGKAVHMVLGFYNAPVNREIGATLLASLPELLESGDIKPNHWEVLAGGLGGIVGGLERMKNDQVSGVKLVARPHETV